MSKRDGGAAFPVKEQLSDQHLVWTNMGMTMRQFYKAAAIAGALANPKNKWRYEKMARFCGAHADAMIAEDERFEKKEGEK